MVVKLSDSQVFILEYAGGVFLYPLFTRLYSYFAIQGREICLRRLSLPHERPEMQAQVEEFVRGVLGQKPPSIEEMVLAVLGQQSILSAFIGRLRGGGGGDDDGGDGAPHAVADDHLVLLLLEAGGGDVQEPRAALGAPLVGRLPAEALLGRV